MALVKTVIIIMAIALAFSMVMTAALRILLKSQVIRRFVKRHHEDMFFAWEMSKMILIIFLVIYAREISDGVGASLYLIVELAKRVFHGTI